MSERPSWMPSDRTLILAAIYVEDKSGSGTGEEEAAENLRDIVREAVEKALAEREARHKRELVEARIEEIALYADSGDDVLDHLADLRAELAALDAKADAGPTEER